MRVIVIRQLERCLFALWLRLEPGQLGEHTDHLFGVPVVVDVARPVIVLGQRLTVVDACAEAADQDVGCGDALLLHQRERGVDAASGGDAEGDASAVLAHHLDEGLERGGVADQVLIQIGEYRAVAVTQRTWRQPAAWYRL